MKLVIAKPSIGDPVICRSNEPGPLLHGKLVDILNERPYHNIPVVDTVELGIVHARGCTVRADIESEIAHLSYKEQYEKLRVDPRRF